MLSFQNCNFCEKTIPQGAALCPHCGHLQKTAAESRRYHRSIILAVLLSIGVMAIWSRLVGFR